MSSPQLELEPRAHVELRIPIAELRLLNLEALAAGRAGLRDRLRLVDLDPPSSGPECALLFGPLPATVRPLSTAADRLERAAREWLEAVGVTVLAARTVTIDPGADR